MKRSIRNILVIGLLVIGLAGCSAKTNSSGSPVQVNLMTFNVRYDNPADSANNWKYRRTFVAETILKYNVDLLGTQEVLVNQLTDLLGTLPQFAYAGVGRKDGKTAGEYSAVFYRKDNFEMLESGTFWLSENPNAIGVKGWDAAIERIVTWVVLKDRTTGKKFVHLNTHFDHIGQVARRESAKLLLSKVEEIGKGLPVFVSGDLNATPDSEVIKILVDQNSSNHLTDSRSLAAKTEGPAWTFHGFGTVPEGSRTIIDYIFVKNNVAVEQLSVISEMKEKLYLSDHNPVLIKASF